MRATVVLARDFACLARADPDQDALQSREWERDVPFQNAELVRGVRAVGREFGYGAGAEPNLLGTSTPLQYALVVAQTNLAKYPSLATTDE